MNELVIEEREISAEKLESYVSYEQLQELPVEEMITVALDVLKIEKNKREFIHVKMIEEFLKEMEFFQLLEKDYGKEIIKKCTSIVFLNKYFPKESLMCYSKENGYISIFIHGKVKQLTETKEDIEGKEYYNNRIEKIVYGNKFGQQIKFNMCAEENSKVIAVLDTEVLQIEKQAFYSILSEYEKKEIIEKMNYFWRYHYFELWDYESIKSLSVLASYVETHKNQIIFDEDSEMESVYFIKSGVFKLQGIVSEEQEITEENNSNEQSEQEYEEEEQQQQEQQQSEQEEQQEQECSLCYKKVIEIQNLEEGDIFGEDILCTNKRVSRIICISSEGELYELHGEHLIEILKEERVYETFENSMFRLYYDRQELLSKYYKLHLTEERSTEVLGKNSAFEKLNPNSNNEVKTSILN